MAKNIEMNYKQGESEYEVLYPNVKVESVIDIEEHYYTKNEINGQISDIIPNPYGVLAVKATDDVGNPVSVQLTVNPQIDGSSTITTDSSSGLFVAFVNPATYNLTAPAGSDFIEYNIDVPSAQVKTNQVTNVNVGVEIVQSGEIEITSSRQVVFPESFNIPVDIWGCGGGPGGAMQVSVKTDNRMDCGVVGGSGAYTFVAKGQNVAGKQLEIQIGNGGIGEREWINSNNVWQNSQPGNGGTTSVSGLDGVLTAKGGVAGSGRLTTYYDGVNGGTGSGGWGRDNSIGMSRAMNAGTDGGDGESTEEGESQESIGGKGQGTTTRKYGEPDQPVYCDASGGSYLMVLNGNTLQNSLGTTGEGAGLGKNFVVTNTVNVQKSYLGNNATIYGSSGGSLNLLMWAGLPSLGDYDWNAGSGKQGVVFIRWPSQST